MTNIFDLSHIKSVKAWALTNDCGEMLGRVLANYSDNPNGSVCTVAVHLWGKAQAMLSLKELPLDLANRKSPQSRAGGYGYDKFASAFRRVMMDHYGMSAEDSKDFDGGEERCSAWFEKHGIKVLRAL